MSTGYYPQDFKLSANPIVQNFRSAVLDDIDSYMVEDETQIQAAAAVAASWAKGLTPESWDADILPTDRSWSFDHVENARKLLLELAKWAKPGASA